MTSEKRFPIEVFEQDGRFYCMVQDLSILENSDSLQDAYEQVKQKKARVLQQYRDANLEALILRPKEVLPFQKIRQRSPLNVAILCFFVLIPTMTLLHPMTRLIHRFANMTEVKPVDLILKIDRRLQNMPEAEKQELKQAVYSIAHEIRNFTTPNEIREITQ